MKNSILGAIESAKQNGGVTYSLNGGVLSNIPFYVLARAEYELRVQELTEEVVKDYILKHSILLGDADVCLGIWKDGEEFVLDITDLWRKDEWQLDGIREIGRLRDQISLFDLEDMVEIKCFDFEIFANHQPRKNCVVAANNRKAIDFMDAIGFEGDICNDKNVFGYGFNFSDFEEWARDDDFFRVEMLQAGLSVKVHNHK